MIEQFLATAVGVVWNYPVALLCLFAGIFFTFRFGLLQIRLFPHAIAVISGKYDNPNEKGQITHFQALSAALSGTIGLGNIAGVAIAIAMGGPGAIFWLWVTGFFGMATKFMECTLGVHYRNEDSSSGDVRGGPMYYILNGLGKKWRPLALFYAITIAVAGLGCASLFQAHEASSVLFKYYSIPMWVTGALLFFLGILVVIGGIKRIGRVTSKIVPFMCVVYMLGAFVICALNFDKIPTVLLVIIKDAFTGKAALGGAIGTVMIMGIRRAVFSNEAGLGSASIAYAAVKTDYPVREGIVASIGPFIDTIIVCTATAIVIVLSGNYGTEMYQSVQDIVLKKNIVYQHQGWSFQDQNIPEETELLRSFRKNDSVLKYHHASKAPTALPLFSVPISSVKKDLFGKDSLTFLGDGLRFSYFQNLGEMQVKVYSQKGDLLSILPLTLPTDGKSLSDDAFFKITPVQERNQWHSAVITFKPALKDQILLKDISKLFVVFEPIGESVEWYFDRFQMVERLEGIALTTTSFDTFLKGFGSIFITFSVFFFAFSTIITWSYYGETASVFVFGDRAIKPYRWLFISMAFVGSIIKLTMILNFADLMLGIVVIPNIVTMLLLSNNVSRWVKEYVRDLKNNRFVTY